MSKTHISENDLDKMLKDIFLQQKTPVNSESLAEFVWQQNYDVPLNPAKEKELLNKLHTPRAGFGNYPFFLSVLIVVLLAIVLMNARHNTSTVKVQPENSAQQNEIKKDPVEKQVDAAELQVQSIKVKKIRDTFARITEEKVIALNDTTKADEEAIVQKIEVQPETDLPYLTEQDRIRFANVKKMMLSRLYNLDEKFYAHVIADKMQYAGKSFITEAYNMKTTGITNLEYKVFLADLISESRKEDYKKAQVKSVGWNAVSCPELARTYFQSEKYNDFPVVNISFDAAKLFCAWLERELTVYMRKNKLKIKPIKIRLPFDYEWLYAARNGYSKIGFAEGYNTIFDLREGLMDQSSAGRLKLIRKRVKRSDTLFDYISLNHFGWDEKKLTDLFDKALSYSDPLPADTIDADRMKLYSKMAHVPEMILEKKSGKIWLIGTSWKSKENYLELESQFNTLGYSPFAGFRPVVIDGNDPIYQNPFPW